MSIIEILTDTISFFQMVFVQSEILMIAAKYGQLMRIALIRWAVYIPRKVWNLIM